MVSETFMPRRAPEGPEAGDYHKYQWFSWKR